ncbi:MAG TPA: SDR family oxidoreductase [Vitreimonas sp.]|uniref:SDR family oxidoreductase n=1 Tax=Vitreimonas sp. TaxID=3069702 RepID=UPI002D6957C2|nr:SDR family oxidoreductase [Vitreimonas sp.]HYD88168.1 SDR family oxidoreductase [Vitreimonas sp.]
MSWALVTGAGQRLGKAVALELARAGWGVIVHYRNSAGEAEAVAAQARELGGAAVTVRADLGNADERGSLIARAIEAAGAPLGALVNCAALFEHDTVATIDEKLLQRQIAINAYTPSLLARDFAQAMPEHARGSVVNFLDFKLANPYPDHFSYTLSKYALAGATELMARALAPRVRVNAVAPGYVLPAPGQSEADFQRLHDDVPLKRGPTPDDIARTARFLIESEAITGQTIYVDAGRRFVTYERDMEFM